MKRSDNIGLGAAQADAAEATSAAKLKAATDALDAAGVLPVALPDLLARQPAPVEWIIEDLLAARGGASRGFKGDIIAGSKMRKTFFALQLAACVAAGRDFLGFKVPKPRRVLYLNLELREDFTRERMEKLTRELGAAPAFLEIASPARPYLLRNRYKVERDGTRELLEGVEDQLLEYINGKRYELIIADPQYKLEFPEEDENTGQGLGGILRWRDRIITETGAACLMVHHDPKCGGADRDLTQRGAGSSFGGRDYDARLALDAHADGDPLHEVLECGSRVRPSPEPVTVVFDPATLTFSADLEIEAKRKTTKKEKLAPAEREKRNREAVEAAARSIFTAIATEVEKRAERADREPEPVAYLLQMKTLQSKIMAAANMGEKSVKDQLDLLLEGGTLKLQQALTRRGDGSTGYASASVFVGLPVHVEAYREAFDLTPTGDEMRRAYRGGKA